MTGSIPPSPVPVTLDFHYAPAPCTGAWVGSCPLLTDTLVEGTSLHQVDLILAPLVSALLETLYGQALAVSAVPGGEVPVGDGCYRKTVPVTPAYMPCTIVAVSPYPT